MIRFSLFLAFFSLVFSLSAQNAESVFLDKHTLDWYDKEVQILETAITQINEEPKNLVAKKQLVKSVELINKNCLSIYHKMDNFLDEETLAPLREKFLQDGIESSALEHRNNKIRANNADSFQELLMTQEDLSQFLNNLSKIKNIDDELKHINYNFAAGNNKSQGTASQLAQLTDLAQKNNLLLKSKYN